MAIVSFHIYRCGILGRVKITVKQVFVRYFDTRMHINSMVIVTQLSKMQRHFHSNVNAVMKRTKWINIFVGSDNFTSATNSTLRSSTTSSPKTGETGIKQISQLIATRLQNQYIKAFCFTPKIILKTFLLKKKKSADSVVHVLLKNGHLTKLNEKNVYSLWNFCWQSP
jgi:hypothetical protein